MLTLPLLLIQLVGCKADDTESTPVPEREAGERAPLTASCDVRDETHCLLPWPNSRFETTSDTTSTGIKLHLDPDAIPLDDSVAWLNASNGYSRVSAVVVGFESPPPADWDPASSLSAESTLQVLVADPDHARYGERIAYRTEAFDASTTGRPAHLLIGRPVEVLPGSTELVALTLDHGTANHATLVSLGLEKPSSQEDQELVSYHAPTRQLLDDAGVDPTRVTRLWDFHTRSEDDAHRRMRHMMAALDDAAPDLDVVIDVAVEPIASEVAMVVKGRITGAPSFLDDEGHMVEEDGVPQLVGTTDVVFRMALPRATDDYRVVLYGHGTGGDEDDDAFDEELAEQGIAKLAMRFDGWTGDDFVHTIGSFTRFLSGSEVSSAGLLESLAGATLLRTALDGSLGDALEAKKLGGLDNPLAGLRPDTTDVPWVGGSMGGTLGAVMVSADERITVGVLNVPGSGWTHMVPHSLLYDFGIRGLLEEVYTNPVEQQLIMAIAQNNWDDVDGAVWAEEALAVGGSFLMQESMDDPVLPNLGTELLANALQAQQMEPVLQPIVGLTTTKAMVTKGAALTQFRVPDTGQYDVHGFAARSTPAGDAAMEQIIHFLQTAWDGQPDMHHPAGCSDITKKGDCDFSGMWSE